MGESNPMSRTVSYDSNRVKGKTFLLMIALTICLPRLVCPRGATPDQAGLMDLTHLPLGACSPRRRSVNKLASLVNLSPAVHFKCLT
jgi:hypothetical protein